MAQNNTPVEQDLNEIVKVRHEQLAALKESGNDPFKILRAKPLKSQAESLPAELWVKQVLWDLAITQAKSNSMFAVTMWARMFMPHLRSGISVIL